MKEIFVNVDGGVLVCFYIGEFYYNLEEYVEVVDYYEKVKMVGYDVDVC